ncbi:MAG: methylated-DNA--[protein]-cysteine S-methyltransferase [Thermoanaerobaculia bacterium]
MQCRSVLTRIDALRTGELENRESDDVREHLEVCTSCHESLDDVEEFAGAIRGLATQPFRSCLSDVAKALTDSFSLVQSGDLRAWVAFSGRGIRMIDLGSPDEESFRGRYEQRFGRALREEALSDRQRSAVERALAGEPGELPEIDLEGLTEFEQKVLRTIVGIPRGEVRSYEWVARKAGRPGAARAVGNIMASNPVPLLLPCHRVVPAAGGIGKYGYGPEMKRRILAAEHAPVAEIERLAKEGVRFIGSRITKIFCCPTCRDARRIREENRVLFHDASEAESHGFRPCRRCTPVAAA